MSSNQRYQRRAIDEAIDRAVGEMMELDPRPGLRRRVLSRIEKPFGRRALWWRGSLVMLPAAALLLIIVAVVTSRWPESSVEVAQTSTPVAPLAPSAPLRRTPAPHPPPHPRTLAPCSTPPHPPPPGFRREATPCSARVETASRRRVLLRQCRRRRWSTRFQPLMKPVRLHRRRSS